MMGRSGEIKTREGRKEGKKEQGDWAGLGRMARCDDMSAEYSTVRHGHSYSYYVTVTVTVTGEETCAGYAGTVDRCFGLDRHGRNGRRKEGRVRVDMTSIGARMTGGGGHGPTGRLRMMVMSDGPHGLRLLLPPVHQRERASTYMTRSAANVIEGVSA